MLCLKIRPQQELRLSQLQKLELRLSSRLLLPTGLDFTEPDPMKRVEEFEGRRVVRITPGEMNSYANGIRQAAAVLKSAQPKIVFVSMRGALPMFRATLGAMTPKYLNSEYRGREWEQKQVHLLFEAQGPSSGHLERCKRMPVTFVKARTSYFLENLSEGIEGCLSSAFAHMRLANPITAVFLDTSVTGTKLGWFMPQFEDAVRQVGEILKKDIHLISVILHHDKDGRADTMDRTLKGEKTTVFSTTHNIGVASIITEDSPTLLGARYSGDELHPKAVGLVEACEEPESVSLMVGDKLYKIEREPSGETAILFARLAGHAAANP